MNATPIWRNSATGRLEIGAFGAHFHLHLASRIQLALAVLLILPLALLAMTSTPAAAATSRIVAFGDSLTAGFRLSSSDAFPAKLQRALKAQGLDVDVTNAGVSGDTTAAGLSRLDWAVPDGTDIVIVQLGANDALRGVDPAVTRRNLDTIITRVKAKGAKVLLAGMLSPRNWGEDYAAKFDAIYPELAKAHGVELYPFFLDGIALKTELNLDDGMHPNPRGVDVIVERIAPRVAKLVQSLGKKQ